MDKEITVRKATTDDLPMLLRFEQGVIAAERPFDSTLKDGMIHYYDIAAMLTDETTEVAVVEISGDIVASGYARIEAVKPFLKYAKHAFLGFMYVLPEHRGKGLNKLIIERLKNFAIANGVNEMRLQVYAGNEPAIKAYEKADFSSLLIEMRMGL